MNSSRTSYYFTTRDLLMMAALAALGGVTSTYVNAIGDLVQSVVGFAGTTQWAAGLHVLWLTLAMGLVGKPGTGTVTGLLKGGVELLSGNTHGLLVVLVDLVAGLCVDLGFLPFRRKDRLFAYAIAGGLASASNVFVFQLFAALPADILAYGAMLIVGAVAFLSGAVFAGAIGWSLLNALRRSGVVKDRAPVRASPAAHVVAMVGAVVLVTGLTIYLRGALGGTSIIRINGDVNAPYTYPESHGDVETTTAEGTLRGTTTRYTGIPIQELVARAEPAEGASMLLVEAADGYAFFISMEEVRDNESLLLAPQGKGQDRAYNVVGAENSKAWVRNVTELTVIGATKVEIGGALRSPGPYDPEAWQFEMDSAQVDLGDGTRKLQGAPLGDIIQSMQPTADADTLIVHTDDEEATLSLSDVLGDDDIRIFTAIDDAGVTYAVARMDGEVIAASVTHIEVIDGQ